MRINKLPTTFFLALAIIATGNFINVVAAEETGDDLGKAADVYNKNKSNIKYQVVCKREAPVGSRIKKKVCRTVASVDNSQREIKRNIQKMRTRVGTQR